MVAQDLDPILTALADPTRRGVVELLQEGPLRAGELAEAFDMSAPTMSKHLRILRTRGLIEEQRLEADARVRVYRLRREPFSALQAWLEHMESFWSDQLASFKAHAERKSPRRRYSSAALVKCGTEPSKSPSARTIHP